MWTVVLQRARQSFWLLLAAIPATFAIGMALSQSLPAVGRLPFGTRSVGPSEIGLIFGYPNGFSWADLGAYVGSPLSGYFNQTSASAIKVHHGRFQHFEPADDNGYAYFPYSELKQFEASQVASGNPPIFITSTYQGQKRPVYFAWSLGLNNNNMVTASPNMWMQAVNVASDSFIGFWASEYVTKRIFGGSSPLPSNFIGLDNCTFRYDLYGVIDDSGKFVAGIPWDPPFPQNAQQYLSFIETFFSKLKAQHPEIQTMCNVGSLQDQSQFKNVYADEPGLMEENLSSTNPRAFARTYMSDEIKSFSWFGSLGRVAILRAQVPRDQPTALRTAVMLYLIQKGPNFFFAPQYSDGTSLAVPPSEYANILSQLGRPLEPPQVTPDPAQGAPYNLYRRRFERGTVYVNWTGASQNIALSLDRPHFDPASNAPITNLTVEDLTGNYVLEPREPVRPPRH